MTGYVVFALYLVVSWVIGFDLSRKRPENLGELVVVAVMLPFAMPFLLIGVLGSIPLGASAGTSKPKRSVGTFAWPPPPIPERAPAAECRPPAPTDRMAELIARRHAVVLELERLEAAHLEAERLVVEHNEAIVGCSTMDRAVLTSEGPSDPDLAVLATRLELEEFDEMLACPVRLRVAAASLPLVEPDDEQTQSSRSVLCG